MRPGTNLDAGTTAGTEQGQIPAAKGCLERLTRS